MLDPVPSCLIICYQRTDQIEGILSAYKDFGGKVVHFAIDGPKSLNEQSRQAALLDKIEKNCKQLNLVSVVRHLDYNVGLSQNILSGLDWFFSLNSDGVIIEDDLVFNSDLFEWLAFALREFRDNSEVMIISGNRFTAADEEGNITASNYPLIWGWATTSTKWIEMKSWFDQNHFDAVKIPRKVRNYWKTGLLRVKTGEVDSWAIPLAYNFRFRSKLCVIPPHNLVENVGVDEYATHTIGHDSNYGLKIGPHISYSPKGTSQFSEEQIDKENIFLEKYVYRISNRHLLGHFTTFRKIRLYLKR
jgi:hypothetical protein